MPFSYPDKFKQEVRDFLVNGNTIQGTANKFNITRPTVHRICFGRKPKRSKWVPKKKVTGDLFEYSGRCLITGF